MDKIASAVMILFLDHMLVRRDTQNIFGASYIWILFSIIQLASDTNYCKYPCATVDFCGGPKVPGGGTLIDKKSI